MPKGRLFVRDGIEYKLGRIRYECRDFGYVDTYTVEENVLYRRRYLFGIKTPFWKIVDRERIPTHVLISLGCCGDTGGWRSRLCEEYPEGCR